jgi:hypothetical protein
VPHPADHVEDRLLPSNRRSATLSIRRQQPKNVHEDWAEGGLTRGGAWTLPFVLWLSQSDIPSQPLRTLQPHPRQYGVTIGPPSLVSGDVQQLSELMALNQKLAIPVAFRTWLQLWRERLNHDALDPRTGG